MSPPRFPGPDDAARRTQWRRERREALRRHHPDRGGDATEMQRELDRVDRRFGAGPGPSVPSGPAVVVPPTLAVRLARRAGRAVSTAIRAGRARTPRGWPGSRRFHDL